MSATDLDKLEGLVRRAVDRLQGLTKDRAHLTREVEQLRTRFEASSASADGDADSNGRAWSVKRDEAVALIRQTLDEIRRD